MEKIYEIEFMEHTNCMKDTVCDSNNIHDSKYLNIGKGPFLIRESEFEKYQKYGKGFRVIRFVGNMQFD